MPPEGRKSFPSQDGKYIALIERNIVLLKDFKNGYMINMLIHSDFVRNVIFSPDGNYIATSCRMPFSSTGDTTIKIWSRLDGAIFRTIEGHSVEPISIDFSQDSRQLVSASSDGTMRLWDIGDSTIQWDHLASNIKFSNSGKLLAYSHDDGILYIKNVETNRDVGRFNVHDDRYKSTSVVFSHDERRIAFISLENPVKIWSIETGNNLKTLQDSNRVSNIVFSSDGKQLLSVSSDEKIRVWDAETGQELSSLPLNARGRRLFSLSPDGRRIAYLSGNTLEIQRIETDKERAIIHLKHSDTVSNIVFSSDGKQLLSVSSDEKIRVWDAETGQELFSLPLNDRATLFSLSPDGKDLALRSKSISEENNIEIFDSKTMKLKFILQGQEGLLQQISFSPNGKKLALVSHDRYSRMQGEPEDGKIRIWDLTPYSLFLHGSKPTPLYFTFIEAVKFLWQLDVQGLEIVHKERTPADMERFGSLLAPPPPGQSKFDQVLEWAEKQQPK